QVFDGVPGDILEAQCQTQVVAGEQYACFHEQQDQKGNSQVVLEDLDCRHATLLVAFSIRHESEKSWQLPPRAGEAGITLRIVLDRRSTRSAGLLQPVCRLNALLRPTLCS